MRPIFAHICRRKGVCFKKQHCMCVTGNLRSPCFPLPRYIMHWGSVYLLWKLYQPRKPMGGDVWEAAEVKKVEGGWVLGGRFPWACSSFAFYFILFYVAWKESSGNDLWQAPSASFRISRGSIISSHVTWFLFCFLTLGVEEAGKGVGQVRQQRRI